jgi:hypothetical protein
MRNFARRLIAYERSENKSSATKTPLGFPVPAKLRPTLAALMGNGGFRALLSRSLALATAELPWLSSVHVKTDGTLEGVEELHAYIGPNEFFQGRVVLLAHLLELLATCIGENLTLRLLREVWLKVPPNDLEFGNRGKYEKTK